MVEDDGTEVVVALFVPQLREGGDTPTMVDDDGMEVVAALFVFSSGKVVALNNEGSLLGKREWGGGGEGEEIIHNIHTWQKRWTMKTRMNSIRDSSKSKTKKILIDNGGLL